MSLCTQITTLPLTLPQKPTSFPGSFLYAKPGNEVAHKHVFRDTRGPRETPVHDNRSHVDPCYFKTSQCNVNSKQPPLQQSKPAAPATTRAAVRVDPPDGTDNGLNNELNTGVSNAVRDKLQELEKEIEKFREENIALHKLREEREKVHLPFYPFSRLTLKALLTPNLIFQIQFVQYLVCTFSRNGEICSQQKTSPH